MRPRDPLLDPFAELMRLLKWRAYEEMFIVNWCGHKVNYTPVPRRRGGCQFSSGVVAAARVSEN